MVNRMVDPTSGEVVVRGRNVADERTSKAVPYSVIAATTFTGDRIEVPSTKGMRINIASDGTT